MSARKEVFLGIDLGGTKTAVCLSDAYGHLLRSERFPTHADHDASEWRARVAEVTQRLLKQEGLSFSDLRGIGASVPGPMSVKEGLIIGPPNMPGWKNVPIREWLESMAGRRVEINNDANAAALAEYRFGEFRGEPDLVYLTMSTGIGAGVITGGRLLQGANDLGGEVGHVTLDPNGPPCPCGLRGCFERYCGGRSFLERVRARLSGDPDSMLSALHGGDLRRLLVSDVARAAAQGDRIAADLWQEYLERLAQGIGVVVMTYNPRAIVMGTIAIHLGETLLEPLRQRLPRYAWMQALRVLSIRPSALGEKIGELSAIALAMQSASA